MSESIVLSALEFEVLWEAERLATRHVALDVPSPGTTVEERAALVGQAWDALASRRLVRRGRVDSELADKLHLLAGPRVSVDTWLWHEHEARGLAVSNGNDALLGVVDGDEVWLIPARDGSLAESAVSIAGEMDAGVGQSTSLPHDVLVAADRTARGDPQRLATALEDAGIPLWQAQEAAGMLTGRVACGQFGAERRGRDGTMRRAGRVVAFHDTDAGRYLAQLRSEAGSRPWATLVPADNYLLATRVWELLEEI